MVRKQLRLMLSVGINPMQMFSRDMKVRGRVGSKG